MRRTCLIPKEATWQSLNYSRGGRTDKGVSAFRQASPITPTWNWQRRQTVGSWMWHERAFPELTLNCCVTGTVLDWAAKSSLRPCRCI